MKSHKQGTVRGIVCAALCLAGASDVSAVDPIAISVGQNESLTTAESTVFSQADVHGTWTIDGSSTRVSAATWGSKINLGTGDGDSAHLVIQNGARLAQGIPAMTVGGENGTGVIDVYDNGTATLGGYANNNLTVVGLTVADKALTDADGGIDVLRVHNAFVHFADRFTVCNASTTARVLLENAGVSYSADKLGLFKGPGNAEVTLAAGTVNTLYSSDSDLPLFVQQDGSGRLIFRGEGDLVINWTKTGKFLKLGDWYDWDYTGTLAIKGNSYDGADTRILSLSDNAFSRMVKGRSVTFKDVAALDLAGHGDRLDQWPTSCFGLALTNSAATTAHLTYEASEAKTLSGRWLADGIDVVKSGAATLTGSNLWARALTVSSGTLKCQAWQDERWGTGILQNNGPQRTAWAEISGLSVAADATLEATKGVLAVTNLDLAAGARLHVGAEGRVKVRPWYACDDEWFRVTFKRTVNGKNVVLRHFYLVDDLGQNHFSLEKDASGNFLYSLNEGFVDSVAYENLQPGQYCYSSNAVPWSGYFEWAQNHNYSKTGIVTYTGDGAGGMMLNEPENSAYVVSENKPETWVSLIIRKASGTTRPILGYRLEADNMGSWVPMSWSVESSPDGIHWTVLDDKYRYRCYTWERPTSVPTMDGYGLFNNGDIFRWETNLVTDVAFAPQGAVRVDANGVLDLTSLDAANVSVSSLEVDWSAGASGRIDNFRPAATGSIRIVNAPDADSIRSFRHPFALGDLAADAFAGWEVYVNDSGEPLKDVTVVYADGALSFKIRRGSVLIFR